MMKIATVTLVVPDYDPAISFYCDVLGFDLIEDNDLGHGKRWVRVTPKGSQVALLLAKADGPKQESVIGNQAGGRVGFFLEIDDFVRVHKQLLQSGVVFVEQPRFEAYGTVAVFRDPFGNLWDLIEPNKAPTQLIAQKF